MSSYRGYVDSRGLVDVSEICLSCSDSLSILSQLSDVSLCILLPWLLLICPPILLFLSLNGPFFMSYVYSGMYVAHLLS
jgi:hypothetical protein